jgi:hypothetical protein
MQKLLTRLVKKKGYNDINCKTRDEMRDNIVILTVLTGVSVKAAK